MGKDDAEPIWKVIAYFFSGWAWLFLLHLAQPFFRKVATWLTIRTYTAIEARRKLERMGAKAV